MQQSIEPFSLVQLLSEYKKITIPKIQRDYAQGRESQSEVREDFLKVLFDALTSETEDGSSSINLDFVYGTLTTSGENREFLPLDGQQRLTTLFLLHWYLAWKDGLLEKFKDIFLNEKNVNSLFVYETRTSSTDFFNELAKYSPENPANETESVKEIIKDEKWYYRSWDLDTTIQSSITMLQAIHEKFRSVKKSLFVSLIDENRSPITFYLLPLEEFKLTDDLYLKMNARGIPLTSFEIFKARYIKHLEKLEGKYENTDKFRIINDKGNSVSLKRYFEIRIDTHWAEFFWNHLDEKTNLYDEAAINFFRVVAMITRDPTKKDYVSSLKNFRNRSKSSTYSHFLEWKWLDLDFAKGIILLLDEWSTDTSKFKTMLPTNSEYFDERKTFKNFVKDPFLQLPEIVQLAGYFFYLRKHQQEIDSQEFEQWMRIVRNLSVNEDINNEEQLPKYVKALHHIVNNISPKTNETLKYFANTKNSIDGFRIEQVTEERLKAALILRNDRWDEIIRKAERHEYFLGQIEFLLDFCGILDFFEENNSNWLAVLNLDDVCNNKLQNSFERYFNVATNMFDGNGLTKSKNFLWERALLTKGNYLLMRVQSDTFLTNHGVGENFGWKRLLRDRTNQTKKEEKQKRIYLRELWDDLSIDGDIEDQLEKIINDCPSVEDRWRSELIKSPAAIKYCDENHNRTLRIESENQGHEVYLMRSTKMNGRNVELYTYCLFKRLQPELTSNWEESHVNETSGYRNGAPGLFLKWKKQNQELILGVKYDAEQKRFVISFEQPIENIKNIQKIRNILINELNFDESTGSIERAEKVVEYEDSTKNFKEFMSELDVKLCNH